MIAYTLMNNLCNFFFIVIEAKKAFIDDVIFPTVTALPSIYQQMTNTRLFLSKDTIRNNLNGKKNNLNFMVLLKIKKIFLQISFRKKVRQRQLVIACLPFFKCQLSYSNLYFEMLWNKMFIFLDLEEQRDKFSIKKRSCLPFRTK